MRFNKLGARILAVVVLLLVVSVGGIAFFSMSISGNSIQRLVNDYEITMAGALANELDATFNRFEGILQSLNALVTTRFTTMPKPEVADIVIPQFGAQNGKFINDLGAQSSVARSLFLIFNPELFGVNKTYMAGFQRQDADSLFKFMDAKSFSPADLIDRNNASTAWFWKPIDTNAPYWSDITVSDSGEETVTYTMPVLIEGKMAAVAGMTFDFSFVRDMLSAVKIYDHGYPFLVNRDMRFLYHPVHRFNGPTFRDVSGGALASFGEIMLKEREG
ncbi:MAG: cache domain-containing protein, partial [Aminobacteriaceae bacterium]